MFAVVQSIIRQDVVRQDNSVLSVDVVQEIASYLDMSTLRTMINLSNNLESSIGDAFALEFYRRGEKFVNWVNSLRVVREVTDWKIVETTHYSDKSRLVSYYSPYQYVFSEQYLPYPALDEVIGIARLSRTTIIDGIEVYYIRSWNSLGENKFSGNFRDNGRHGLCEEWNDHYKKRFSGTYKDGRPHGLCEHWSIGGVKIISNNYKNGQFHGLCEDWNDQGVKTLSEHYKDGQFHGLCDEWNDQGVKTLSEHYEDGRRHGLCEHWDDQGVKTFSGYYKNGSL